MVHQRRSFGLISKARLTSILQDFLSTNLIVVEGGDIEEGTINAVTRDLKVVAPEVISILCIEEGPRCTTCDVERGRHDVTNEVLTDVERLHRQRTGEGAIIFSSLVLNQGIETCRHDTHDRLVLTARLVTCGTIARLHIELAISDS